MLEIAKADVVARMNFDNPWWTENEPDVPFNEQPRRRYFQSFLEKIQNIKLRRAVILMGPRRVGKTVMVYQAIGELLKEGVRGDRIFYVSLETPIYTGFSLEALLRMFLDDREVGRKETVYIFFDEIQYLKNWEIHLKSLVDSFPNFRFVATGSAAAALRLKSQESGAGRFSDYVLPPLTFAEYLSFIGKDSTLIEARKRPDKGGFQYFAIDLDELNDEFVNYLNYGGYPEAVIVQDVRDNPEQYIKSDIIDKVLLRDLPSLYGISDIQELNRLFNTLAYNTGNEVSLDNLSKSSGVAKNTIRKYLEYLEAAFLIRRVERLDCSAKQFKRATAFKVYLTNPSMRSALFGRIGPDDSSFGQLVETAIYSQWQHSGRTTLYYARWGTGEVDIVSLTGSGQQAQWAVEVKWSDRPFTNPSELKSCIEFLNKNKNINSNDMLITSRTKTGFLEAGGYSFRFVPAAEYAYTLGMNLLSKDPWGFKKFSSSPSEEEE
ncbi:ATP-binding protein [Stenotrophomonas sp.]|uniref:ATP-binding protein n=1 Tax=Stenotrophomonas sp. TaxID=69392 RepID=UPI0028AB47D7|nr:ATP-binding protein [Stenotrophomonas sp.]